MGFKVLQNTFGVGISGNIFRNCCKKPINTIRASFLPKVLLPKQKCQVSKFLHIYLPHFLFKWPIQNYYCPRARPALFLWKVSQNRSRAIGFVRCKMWFLAAMQHGHWAMVKKHTSLFRRVCFIFGATF